MPWFGDPRRENHGLSRKAAAKRLFGVNRALSLAAFSVPRRSFWEHGPWQRQTAEKTRKANRGAAHTFSPAIKGAAFHPATGAAEGSPPHPCPVVQEEQPQLRRRQRPAMRGARSPFHGAITARSGVNSRSLLCQENTAQDRSIAPAAEAGALKSLAVSVMRRRWLGSAESAFAGWLPSLSILFFWTA